MLMPRPRWAPENELQRRAIAAAKRAARRADEAEDLVWKAVEPALDLGVPASYMADVVGRSRTTLYRRVPRPSSTEEERG